MGMKLLCVFAALLSGVSVAQKPVGPAVDSGSGSASRPVISAVGQDVFMVWQDSKRGLRSNWSEDGGRLWQSTDTRIPMGENRKPDSARSGSMRYVVTAGSWKVFFNRSADGGQTWLPQAITLDDGSGTERPFAFDRKVACSGPHVCVAWVAINLSSRTMAIMARVSHDSGLTFSPTVRLNAGLPLEPHANTPTPSIVFEGSNCVVAWQETTKTAPGIYANRSGDNGSTWLAVPLRVSERRTGVNPPRLAMSGKNVHAVWVEWRSSVPHIRYRHSVDAANTWLGSPIDLDTSLASNQTKPLQSIDVEGQRVLVAFHARRVAGSDSKIYANRSLDGGASWLSMDVEVSPVSLPKTFDHSAPHVTIEGEAFTVAWRRFDTQAGQQEFWFRGSTDAGASWSGARRIDGAQGFFGFAYDQGLTSSDGSVHAVWTFLGRVYHTLTSGWQSYGTGLAGSGGIVPSLGGSGNVQACGQFNLEIADGLGAASALVLVGISPASQIASPLLGGVLLVQPLFSLNVVLSGQAGIAGAGSLVLPMTIPAAPQFLGANINFQAGVLDAGAQQAVSFTSAVAIWGG